MKAVKSFMKGLGGKALIVALIVLAGFGVRQKLERTYEDNQARTEDGEVNVYEDGSRVGRDLDYAENVPEDNKILQEFKKLYPQAKVLVACEEDLTNDGCSDLVVIFNQPEERRIMNMMPVHSWLMEDISGLWSWWIPEMAKTM